MQVFRRSLTTLRRVGVQGRGAAYLRRSRPRSAPAAPRRGRLLRRAASAPDVCPDHGAAQICVDVASRWPGTLAAVAWGRRNRRDAEGRPLVVRAGTPAPVPCGGGHGWQCRGRRRGCRRRSSWSRLASSASEALPRHRSVVPGLPREQPARWARGGADGPVVRGDVGDDPLAPVAALQDAPAELGELYRSVRPMPGRDLARRRGVSAIAAGACDGARHRPSWRRSWPSDQCASPTSRRRSAAARRSRC